MSISNGNKKNNCIFLATGENPFGLALKSIFLLSETHMKMKNYLIIAMLLICGRVSGQYLPYCLPPAVFSPCGAITNLSIGTFNHTTATFPANVWAAHNRFYCDSLPPIVLYRDSTYILSVKFDTALPHEMTDNSWYCIGIPFDTTTGYDQFYTPIRFYRSGFVGTVATPITDTFHVTIPHSALLGITRLRIVRWGKGVSSTYPLSPRLCMDAAHSTSSGMIGETRDYCLDIKDAPPVDTSHGTDTTNPSLFVQNINSTNDIFPNPTVGVLYFPEVQHAAVRVSDINGRTVYENSDFTGKYITVESLFSGLYTIRINDKCYLFRKY